MNKYEEALQNLTEIEMTMNAWTDSEEKAKEYCKLPEGKRPSGLCYLSYKEYEVK